MSCFKTSEVVVSASIGNISSPQRDHFMVVASNTASIYSLYVWFRIQAKAAYKLCTVDEEPLAHRVETSSLLRYLPVLWELLARVNDLHGCVVLQLHGVQKGVMDNHWRPLAFWADVKQILNGSRFFPNCLSDPSTIKEYVFVEWFQWKFVHYWSFKLQNLYLSSWTQFMNHTSMPGSCWTNFMLNCQALRFVLCQRVMLVRCSRQGDLVN